MGSGIALKARVAGLLYVLLILGGVFAEVFVRGSFLVAGDAAATAARIRDGEQLFRLGITADIAVGLSYLVVVVVLYEATRITNRTVALVAACFGGVGVAVFAANLVVFFASLLFAQSGATIADADALALTSLRLHGAGYRIAMVFFGFHLLLVGSLIAASSYLPRWLGALWMLGGATRIGFFLMTFAAPAMVEPVRRFLTAPGSIAEIVMALWLTVFAVNAVKWRAQAEVAD